MKGMRDGKGPITSSANKLLKELEATVFFTSSPRSGRSSAAAAVVTTVKKTVQSISVVCADGVCSAREVKRKTRVSYGSVGETLWDPED